VTCASRARREVLDVAVGVDDAHAGERGQRADEEEKAQPIDDPRSCLGLRVRSVGHVIEY
jgi:hypothetical protein